MKTDEILNLKIDHAHFSDELTIRGYLHMLLSALWRDEECFSGKRPFGSSGWKYDIYAPLIRAGLVEGKLDEYNLVDKVDVVAADKIVQMLIDDCFAI